MVAGEFGSFCLRGSVSSARSDVVLRVPAFVSELQLVDLPFVY